MQEAGPVAGGAKAAIAGVALQLTTTSAPINKGIVIQALSTNTAPVYVGIAGVTAASGFPIAAGTTSPVIPVNDPSTLYVISTGGSQEVRWIGA